MLSPAVSQILPEDDIELTQSIQMNNFEKTGSEIKNFTSTFRDEDTTSKVIPKIVALRSVQQHG